MFKKFIILLSLLFLSFSTLSFAAGTVTIDYADVIDAPGRVKARTVTISWTADGADGTVPSTTLTMYSYGVMGWYLYSAETNPGSTAPTTLYDIVLNDADGVDIAGGLLANRSATATELVNIGTASAGYPIIRTNLSFVLTNNSVNSATGTLILIFVPN